MNKQTLVNDLNASLAEVQEAIAGFNEQTFAAPPRSGGWSAAQVAEHLIVTEAAAAKALAGDTVVNNRDPAAKVPLIEAVMRDETKRMAPPMVMPAGRVTTPQQAAEMLNRQRQKLVDAVNTNNDLTDACTAYKHPALGTLTKWEWVHFVVHHMRRHLKELQRLQREG